MIPQKSARDGKVDYRWQGHLPLVRTLTGVIGFGFCVIFANKTAKAAFFNAVLAANPAMKYSKPIFIGPGQPVNYK